MAPGMVKIAVTGGSGFIGARLIHELLERGHTDVRAIDIRRGAALDGLPVEVRIADVRDPGAMFRALEGVELLYHLAAVISVDGDPDGRVASVNHDGVRVTAASARRVGVQRMIHVSSIHAFDLDDHSREIDEDTRRIGTSHSAYERSKLAGELALRAEIDAGLDAVICNPTGVLGPGELEGGTTTRVIEHVLSSVSRRSAVTVAGGFDFVDVRDVCASLIAASERGRCGHNYILGGRWISTMELTQILATRLGCSPPTRALPLSLLRLTLPLVRLGARLSGERPAYTAESLRTLAANRRISSAKARRELGHAPRPIAETLADACSWHLSTAKSGE